MVFVARVLYGWYRTSKGSVMGLGGGASNKKRGYCGGLEGFISRVVSFSRFV